MKKKFLIVGGTGFIGYHLISKLKKRKAIVHSISTRKPKKNRTITGVKYIISDISNIKNLKKKIKKNYYNYVINLAGYVDHKNKSRTYKSHYIGCKNLSKIFLKSKIKKFIQMGSSGEYGNLSSPHSEDQDASPTTIYNLSKKKASNFLINKYIKEKFPVTIFRLYLTYGPRQDENRFIPIVINNCLRNKNFNLSHCKQFRDFIYIDDVIDIIISSLDNNKCNGKIINIGTGKPLKLKNIVNKIKKLIKKGKPKFGHLKLRKDEILKIYPKIDEAKKLLKWKPKIKFNKGLNKTIKYYKSVIQT